MQELNRSLVKPAVIVRAWGDEPVRLLLYRIENKRCYVGNDTARYPIGLPFDQVAVFDSRRYSQLCTAFRDGDIRKLGELWANIPVDDFACNKYL